MACSEVAAFLVQIVGHIIFRIFSSQRRNSLVFARQIANIICHQ